MVPYINSLWGNSKRQFQRSNTNNPAIDLRTAINTVNHFTNIPDCINVILFVKRRNAAVPWSAVGYLSLCNCLIVQRHCAGQSLPIRDLLSVIQVFVAPGEL